MGDQSVILSRLPPILKMKETIAYLKERWQSDFKDIRAEIDVSLKKGRQLSKLVIPTTSDGLIDLRGYSAPKTYKMIKSNSGRLREYVNESIRVRRIDFINADLSYSDLERCVFINCRFEHCKFKFARFFASEFLNGKFINVIIEQANFGYSTFNTGILGIMQDNFSHVKFINSNFSECHFIKQRFESCYLSDCKTGAMLLNDCDLNDIKFVGNVKNLIIKKSKKVKVDFRETLLIGIQIDQSSLEGFLFPEGDNYFKFKNKDKELKEIKLPNNLTNDQIELVNTIKSIWLSRGKKDDFVDINWLNDSEIEIGKLVIKELKIGGNK